MSEWMAPVGKAADNRDPLGNQHSGHRGDRYPDHRAREGRGTAIARASTIPAWSGSWRAFRRGAEVLPRPARTQASEACPSKPSCARSGAFIAADAAASRGPAASSRLDNVRRGWRWQRTRLRRGQRWRGRVRLSAGEAKRKRRDGHGFLALAKRASPRRKTREDR
ncbi:hypothetical protein MTO96_003680 [Rhipicephalus appendiculatus]